MSSPSTIKYYADLLIAQYRDKPKARATIELMADMILIDELAFLVRDAFDLETAIGVQLDVVGKYQNVTRTGNGFSGFITLSDDDFRQLIKMAIVLNSSEANLYEIQDLLFTFFPNQITLYDMGNMRFSYLIHTSVGSNELAQLFVTKGLLPKPTGVQLSATTYSDGDLYGMVSYEVPDRASWKNSPMNDYNDYKLTYPWLDYLSGITEGDVTVRIETEDGIDIVVQENGDILFY